MLSRLSILFGFVNDIERGLRFALDNRPVLCIGDIVIRMSSDFVDPRKRDFTRSSSSAVSRATSETLMSDGIASSALSAS